MRMNQIVTIAPPDLRNKERTPTAQALTCHEVASVNQITDIKRSLLAFFFFGLDILVFNWRSDINLLSNLNHIIKWPPEVSRSVLGWILE